MKSHLCQLGIVLFFVVVSSCQIDDPPLPDNLVNFESSTIGMNPSETELSVTINFSRKTDEKGDIVLSVTLSNVQYVNDFVTTPLIANDRMTLPMKAGESSVSFKVTKITNLGDEAKITFTIHSVSASLVIGKEKELVMSFQELLIEQATELSPKVGGEEEPNAVFVDLSSGRQQIVSRDAWDLGFYTQGGKDRVIINMMASMMVRQLDKTDLNTVTPSDAVSVRLRLSLDAVFAALSGASSSPEWTHQEAPKWIDNPSGDMTKTAIDAISRIPEENKVYIVNRGKRADGTERGWKKIRILRTSTHYILRYANIEATSYETLEIPHGTPDYLFNYINFDSGSVAITPKKERWDIAFTVFTNLTAFGPPGSPKIPYVYKDVVIQNRYKVGITEVMITDDITYENFKENSLSSITFSSPQLTIGRKWRSTHRDGTSELKKDRFYLIKDHDKNIYKLRFKAMKKDGVRGNPTFEYELVQKGK